MLLPCRDRVFDGDGFLGRDDELAVDIILKVTVIGPWDDGTITLNTVHTYAPARRTLT
jgi:hypothetical protein